MAFRPSALLLLVLASVTLSASVAEAQRRGGRFGGSSFRSGGRSSGSSFRGSRSRARSSRARRPYVAAPSRRAAPSPFGALRVASVALIPRAGLGTSHILGTPAAPAAERAARFGGYTVNFLSGGAGAIALTSFPLFLLLGWAFGPRKGAVSGRGAQEVRRVSIAFDAGARRAMQATLDRMADTLPMETGAEMRAAAGKIAEALLEGRASARYFTYQSRPTGGDGTEQTFRQWTMELAARYQRERDENAEGLTAKANEGEGLVVVSLVLATAGPQPPLPDAKSPEGLDASLRALNALDAEVLALEVTWSPAEEMDRMSSLELEQLYPELQRLDDGLAFGRVACDYCSAPFPAELGTCPACGALGPSTVLAAS